MLILSDSTIGLRGYITLATRVGWLLYPYRPNIGVSVRTGVYHGVFGKTFAALVNGFPEVFNDNLGEIHQFKA